MKRRLEAGSGGENIIVGHKAIAEFIDNNSPRMMREYFLQEAPAKIEGSKQLPEFRAHSLWGVFTHPLKTYKVNRFLQDFLDSLPEGLKIGHAWSFDIIEISPQKYSIVDINVSGSHGGNWSGFLQNPFVLSRMVHMLITDFGWTFPGLEGFLLKNRMGNHKKVKAKLRRMYQKHGLFIKPAK